MVACPACGNENADDARFCSACGVHLEPGRTRREVRKTVTVVFSDVVGSTAVGERLDPESLRRVMSRYFDAMSAVLERHGATVEKFIGDAIMAVFGIPVVHEDDALRAVRAAAEMRDELAGLNDELERDYGVRIEARTGITTGEVVAGDPTSGQRLVTGDAVNVAKRLEEAAPAGEVLLGEQTYGLVREAVEAAELEPVAAKGKLERVRAYRLVRVVEGAEMFAPRLESPLVGRQRELELLRQAYRRAVAEQSCHLFTVLGAAGIGKSRLVQEFLTELGGPATVVVGRCLSYGEGITYWPLVEILEQLGSRDAIARALEGEPEARTIINTVLAAVGQAEVSASPEETPWAVRKLLEALARERPLVVVLDDLQWGEPTLLDVVEHIADFSRGAPILLLCLARPELLDNRPGWGGGKLNATSILLEPLNDEAAAILIENLLAGASLSAETRTRVSAAAEGNPLFVEQMLAMLDEDGAAEADVAVPPTIHALLAARLDRLGDEERAVIERAAVIGKEFWLRALLELAPEPERVASALHLLVRKELVRPHRSPTFPRDEGFRFRHLLIRDAAYAALPKELRAELHERLAEWLEGERSEFDDLVGYHLEQAYRYRSELGPLDDHGRELATRAGALLGAAGERALARSDMPAAANLLGRALEVLPEDDPRRNRIRLGLGEALRESDIAAAAEVLGRLVDDASAAGDRGLEWRARVTLLWQQVLKNEVAAREAAETAAAAIAALRELGDEGGLARAWRAAAQVRNMIGDERGRALAMRQANLYARKAGDTWLVTETSFWFGLAAFWGETPVDEALSAAEQGFGDSKTALQRAHDELWRGAIAALAGDFDGLEPVARARAFYRELGLRGVYGGTAIAHATVTMLAGDPVAAETLTREAAAELERLGNRGYRANVLSLLGEAVYAQGRYEEARQIAADSRAITSPDDAHNVVCLASLDGKLAARSGDFARAEELALEGVRLSRARRNPFDTGDAEAALAEVLALAARVEDARATAERARAAYEQKGVVPAIEGMSRLVAELAPA
jgi:class 3 adenylate cyclase